MARREDYHQQKQRQIHYATIMPSNANPSTTTTTTNGHGPNQSPVIRKQTELERAKAVRFLLLYLYRIKNEKKISIY